MLPDKTEHHSEVACEEEGPSDDADQGKASRHQARLVQQEAQQQVADGRHEALPLEEDAVIQGGKRMAGDQCTCSSTSLPQGHDRHKEHHADEDGGGFQNSGGNQAQRGRFVLLLEHREQHDGGADASESHDDLQDTADDGGSVRASAEDVVRTLYRAVEKEGRDRDKGEQVEHARDKRGLSTWTHLKRFTVCLKRAYSCGLSIGLCHHNAPFSTAARKLILDSTISNTT